ncbi:MAG TPA: hypothetical protein DEO32_01485 [Ruminococcaceae bacterium]|nr:hypothetical protein [Oscillospiraceae bacterium]
MKKAICIAATGVILISSVFIGELSAPSNASAAGASAHTEPNKYVIKSESGRLVVYKKGADAPFMTTETFSTGLPKSDADRLAEGVEVEGEQKLRKTLEDYCS